MAIRTTNFPVGRRMKAFRAVERILREDPGLISGGVKVRSYSGDQMDGVEISTGQCPMLRISPKVIPNNQITQFTSIARFAIKVEIFAAGMIAEDIVNFWDAIEAAMVRSKPFDGSNVQCYLNLQAGVHRSQVLEPGFGSWESKNPPDKGLAGVGQIEVDFLIKA